MKENREALGYCNYCKGRIYEDDAYVIRYNNKYHIACFDLIKTDTFGRDVDDFTETDGE